MAATKTTKYLIIGNSAGGIGAAEAIRETDRKGSITIISDEPYPAYSRPLISEYLASPGPIEKMAYRRPDFYEVNGIRTALGERVKRVDPAGHAVTLTNGDSLGFEKLLLATGGAPIIPELEGIPAKGVFTFNKLDDAKAIDGFLKGLHREAKAVVIGGGLIGVSVTDALVKRGVEVTIVEMKDRILNTILDEDTSALEAKVLAEAGIKIITDHTAAKVNSHLPGEVSGVTLDDGRLLPAGMVIVAIGVRPRLDAVEGSGIKVNRGILVNRQMETSAPDIYACGDVSEAYDFVIGENRLTPVWPNAYEGGRTAGLNMAGGQAEYAGGTAMNAMKYFGMYIVSAGLTVPPDGSYDTLVNRSDGNYRKVLVREGKLAGLVFAGDIEKSGIIYNLMKEGIDVSGFKEELVEPDFGLASVPEEAWRPRLAGYESKVIPVAVGHPDEPEEELGAD
jgi:NAD(P)H-nitrite reductase large subunit